MKLSYSALLLLRTANLSFSLVIAEKKMPWNSQINHQGRGET